MQITTNIISLILELTCKGWSINFDRMSLSSGENVTRLFAELNFNDTIYGCMFLFSSTVEPETQTIFFLKHISNCYHEILQGCDEQFEDYSDEFDLGSEEM